MIFDIIRKKFVELSPEEWVRQNLVSFLIHEKHYPKSLISLETGLKLNNTQKRTDVIVYNTNKKINVLAECKAPSVKITTKVVEQALRYNLVEQATFIVISNGIVHIWYHVKEGKITQINELPDFK